ncbi:hypothetical protein MRX96_059851 [Rhipicephalus microplus]
MRGNAFTVVISVLCTANVAVAKLGSPGGPRKLHYDEPNSFQVLKQFKDVMAISDSDNDTIFDCLVSHRTNIKYETQTATYVWNIKGGNSSSKPGVVFQQLKPGRATGTLDVIMGDDPNVKEAILYYTDDKCCVADIEYNGHQCILWVQRSLKDTVPQVCIDQFVDTCGVVVDPHGRDLCIDGEGDY